MAYTVFALAPKPDRAACLAIINRLVNNGIDPQQGIPRVQSAANLMPTRRSIITVAGALLSLAVGWGV
jgi:hypothetical protein